MSLMDFDAYGREMARFNAWQNRILFGLCADIGDAARRADRGMFFGSVHATLNHILFIDLRIIDMIAGREPAPFEPRTIVCDDFDDLRKLREQTDGQIKQIASAPDKDWQDGRRPLTGLDGEVRHLPLQVFFMQMFNHQTHHRAQITSELHKMGVDYGCTGVPFTPGLPY